MFSRLALVILALFSIFHSYLFLGNETSSFIIQLVEHEDDIYVQMTTGDKETENKCRSFLLSTDACVAFHFDPKYLDSTHYLRKKNKALMVTKYTTSFYSTSLTKNFS